jgi:enolase
MARAIGDKLGAIITEVYGADAGASMGDEGGFVIPEARYEVPFQLLTRAVKESGNDGKVRFAIDAAASSFFHGGTYTVDGRCVDAGWPRGVGPGVLAAGPPRAKPERTAPAA